MGDYQPERMAVFYDEALKWHGQRRHHLVPEPFDEYGFLLLPYGEQHVLVGGVEEVFQIRHGSIR